MTTVPLPLLDLSPLLAPENLARACHEAGVRYRTTPSDVARARQRRPTEDPGALLHELTALLASAAA